MHSIISKFMTEECFMWESS